MRRYEPLNESDLAALLDKTFLRGIQYFSQTDSTNRQALNILTSDSRTQTPCLVYAESQTAGRGRGSNQWWSSAGSLTFSVIVNVQEFRLTPAQLIKLPLLTGLAVLRTGESVLPPPPCPATLQSTTQIVRPTSDFALKWPNDVYLSGRKFAGILIDVPAPLRRPPAECDSTLKDNQSPRHAIIGVGVNVNNSFSNAPAELQATGISLSDYSGQHHQRLKILETFLLNLEKLIRSLAQGIPILDDWPDHCLLTGKQVTLLVGETTVTGLCHGIAPTGALALQTAQGPQQFLGGIVTSWTTV